LRGQCQINHAFGFNLGRTKNRAAEIWATETMRVLLHEERDSIAQRAMEPGGGEVEVLTTGGSL